MDLGLEGRVSAVAAATSGLGLAVATELVREGASVGICSRAQDHVDRAMDLLSKEANASGSPAEVFGCTADLGLAGEPERFVSAIVDRFGRLDVLIVNNGGPPAGPVVGLGDSAWEEGFRGTFQVAQRMAEAAVPELVRNGWGRILFLTSTSVKQPIEGLVVSTAMRSAVVGYAKALADDLAHHGITVNCLAPGSISTPRLRSLLKARAASEGSDAEVEAAATAGIPMRRFGRPEEFAAVAAFLASERASYVTGTVLQVDGGAVRSLT